MSYVVGLRSPSVKSNNVKLKFGDKTNNDHGHVQTMKNTLKMLVGGISNYITATSRFYQLII